MRNLIIMIVSKIKIIKQKNDLPEARDMSASRSPIVVVVVMVVMVVVVVIMVV